MADYVRRNVDHVVAISLTGTLGLGGTQSDIPFVPNPSDHFTAVLGQLNLAKRLGGGFELRSRLVGQYSAGTLYSGERLSIGGASSVRGYRESFYLVDRGLIGTAELAYAFSLAGRPASRDLDWGAFTVSLFTDAALFRNATEPQLTRKFISSIGASLSWTPTQAFTAIATYGHALQDVTGPQQDDLQDRGFHFRILVHPHRLF
jgi:hemolysin activation/secretion protein